MPFASQQSNVSCAIRCWLVVAFWCSVIRSWFRLRYFGCRYVRNFSFRFPSIIRRLHSSPVLSTSGRMVSEMPSCRSVWHSWICTQVFETGWLSKSVDEVPLTRFVDCVTYSGASSSCRNFFGIGGYPWQSMSRFNLKGCLFGTGVFETIAFIVYEYGIASRYYRMLALGHWWSTRNLRLCRSVPVPTGSDDAVAGLIYSVGAGAGHCRPL